MGDSKNRSIFATQKARKGDMTQEELYEIIASDESFRIELTTSTGDMDKFQEAICAFANDMPGSRKKGYLLIGARTALPQYSMLTT